MLSSAVVEILIMSYSACINIIYIIKNMKYKYMKVKETVLFKQRVKIEVMKLNQCSEGQYLHHFIPREIMHSEIIKHRLLL